MVFGYTGRDDLRDSHGNTWRPATELVTRIGEGKDSVADCWWTTPVAEPIGGTPDPDLYRYGVHGRDFWVNLTVGPGRYYARLKFAATRGLDTRTNCFDIRINGRRVAERLDVAATAGGPDRAVDLVFNDLAPANGVIEIRFTASGMTRQDRQARHSCKRSNSALALAAKAPGATPVSAAAAGPRRGRPFDYFQNSWSVIGLKDYNDGTRITPDNELLLANKTRLRLSCGPNLTPLSRKQTKTLLDGWLPVVLLTTEEDGVRYDFTLWATPFPTVKDWRAAFDWPTEGDNFLNWVRVKATNLGSDPAEARVQLDRAVDQRSRARRLERAAGAGADARDLLPRSLHSRCRRSRPLTRKSPKAVARPHGELLARPHGQSRAHRSAVRESHPSPPRRACLPTDCQRPRRASRRRGFLRSVLHPRRRLPDARTRRGRPVRRRAQDRRRLPPAQRPDGRFETQKDQLDANGQALWALWQFYKITGDRAWLHQAYPQMRRAAEWTMQARREAPSDSPFAGLLPNALADGEYLWDGKHHIVGYDFWNLRGLLCVADAARELGERTDAQDFQQEAENYRQRDRRRLEAHRPGLVPAELGKGGHALGQHRRRSGRRSCSRRTTRASARCSRRCASTRRRLLRRHDPLDRVQGAGHPPLPVRPTPRWPRWSAASTTSSSRSSTGICCTPPPPTPSPRASSIGRRFAWSDTIPHATGAANFAFLLRHALVHEQGDELHLLLGAPDWWLENGREIRIENAPTHFGTDEPEASRHRQGRRDQARPAPPPAAHAHRPAPAHLTSRS